jgi:ribosomal protein S8
MKDYLNDMIVRIRNNSAARVPYVFMHPYLPKRYLKILNILYREGYIRGYSEHFAIIDGKPRLSVFLKYNLSGEPIIENIFRVSGQGRKIYIGTKAL